MSGLSIGGYKNNSGETPLINLSSEVEDTEEKVEQPFLDNEEEDIVQQETPTEVVEDIENNEGVAEVTPELDINEGITPELPTEEVITNEPQEVSEELLLKRLSEKLGREVTSFDELTGSGENQLEEDPYLKGLSEWRQKTNRPIEDWVKFNQDFNKVSDADIAREFLQIEYPELDANEINLELSTKFISSDEDMDNEAALKNLELKKYASKGRKELEKMKVQFGEPNLDNFSPEVKQSLQLAEEYKAFQNNVANNNKVYNEGINRTANTLKSIKMNLGEELALDFKLPEGSQKGLIDMIQNAPHWKKEDGSWNHEAVVRDAAIVANFETMLKIAYEQGKSSGSDEVVREAKNTTLGNRVSNDGLSPKTGGIQIEGLDKYLGKTGMKIRNRN